MGWLRCYQTSFIGVDTETLNDHDITQNIQLQQPSDDVFGLNQTEPHEICTSEVSDEESQSLDGR
jgi:hypothetical protein